MGDEPSNAASEALLFSVPLFAEGPPPTDSVRASLTDGFTYEDRRRGVSFPDADAESYPKNVASIWQTGAGRPEFEVLEILAVRGDRFAAALVRLDYGNGMLFESIHVLALDATLSLAQREIDFDLDDIDGAMAELDRLHREADAPGDHPG